MKKVTGSALALVAALATALPAVAQQSAVRQGNETAMEMAARIGVCGGAGINTARFSGSGDTLRVRCANAPAGMEGGLGGGALLAGLVVVAVVAAASGGSGSSSTSSTPGTI
ncbi:MAG: hypothetical protein ACU0AX_09480 [Roseovarius sp.]|uniref:hypothetical protein n=1 Tax=Roseovarius sp. TaxID=1486281 RepID=UPI004058ACFA